MHSSPSGPPFRWHKALISLPGVLLSLLGGMLADTVTTAAIMAGAAFSIGFVADRQSERSPVRALLLTGAGMVVASFAGTFAGRIPAVETIAGAALAWFCGASARQGSDGFLVWLQILIAFLLAASFAVGINEASHRAMLVACGATVQIGSALVIDRWLTRTASPAPPTAMDASKGDVVLHGGRAAICVMAALIASHILGLSHGYWAAMTAIVVLKPGLRDTWLRGLVRTGGTLLGVLFATAIVTIGGSSPTFLGPLMIVGAGIVFGLQGGHYPLFVVILTITVLMMAALGGLPMLAADTQRIVATILGGAIAIAGAGIAPRRRADDHCGGT